MHGKIEREANYDPHFTDMVIAATGCNANPRLKQIMPALIRHLHDFAREVDLTVAEWMTGVEMINEAGRMSTDRRNETQLICDILGLESLVDEISSKILMRGTITTTTTSSNDNNNSSKKVIAATPSAVLGPFYRANAPLLENGSSIISASMSLLGEGPELESGMPSWYAAAQPLLSRISGRVISASTGQGIPGATVDVWLAGPNGLYEQQDPEQPDMNLRGRFRTDESGGYDMYAMRPTAYAIPSDGPAGRLLDLLDRRPHRPAHIHFIVSAAGYEMLTTQVFDRDDGYVNDDAVFAVKPELLVDFVPREGDEMAKWELVYDFCLREI